MPGELIEAADPALWPLVELEGLLTGIETPYDIVMPPGIRGLGVRAKTSRSPYHGHHGTYGAPDFQASPVITVPYAIGGVTPAEAMNYFAILRESWSPVVEDVELHLRLPGWGHIYLLGRPVGLDDDLVELGAGEIGALATFEALDPTIYTAGS